MAFIGKNPKWNTSLFTPQSTEPANPVEGMVYYDDGTNRPEGLYVYKNSVWTQAGGVAGVRNFDSKGDADVALTSDFTSSGLTFSLSTTAADIIDGQQVFKAVAGAASQTVESNSGNIPVPQGFRGRTLKINMQYKGNSNDWTLTIKDKTNTADLAIQTISAATGSNNIANELNLIFHCPSDCEQLSYEFESSAADTIIWDEVIISDENLFDTEVNQLNTFSALIANNGTATLTSESTNFIASVNRSALGKIDITFVSGFFSVAPAVIACEDDASGATFSSTSGNITTTGCTIESFNAVSNAFQDTNVSIIVHRQGDDFKETNKAISSFATDVENTYSALIENLGGTDAITSQSSEWIASTNRTATGVVDITFVSGFFNGVIPSITATVTDGAGTGSEYASIRNLTATGCTVKTEDINDNDIDRSFSLIAQRQGDDYRDPTRSIVRPTSLTCFIKDVKSSGTSGGALTSGIWQARTLNTVEGDSSFVSLSSNQFTLDAGKYLIEAIAPGAGVDNHRIRIKVPSEGSARAIGSAAATGLGGVTTHSTAQTVVDLTESTIFEIQHRCSTTNGSTGGGVAASFGVDEVYTVVKITKVL